jgi:hypothetical protein
MVFLFLVLILCKGERVSSLPPSFLRFPFVRLTKWDNESVIVPRGAAILLINDLLLANPVFAQPYPSHDPLLLLAAFPMSENSAILSQEDIFWNESNVRQIFCKGTKIGVSFLKKTRRFLSILMSKCLQKSCLFRQNVDTLSWCA